MLWGDVAPTASLHCFLLQARQSEDDHPTFGLDQEEGKHNESHY